MTRLIELTVIFIVMLGMMWAFIDGLEKELDIREAQNRARVERMR